MTWLPWHVMLLLLLHQYRLSHANVQARQKLDSIASLIIGLNVSLLVR